MWHPQRLIGALLALVSAILLLVSPFFPLFLGHLRAGPQNFTVTISGWGFATDAPVRIGAAAVNAYGLIFAAVLLFLGTVATFVGARNVATPRNRRFGATVMGISAAFTLGVAVSVIPQLTNWVDTFRPVGPASVDTAVGVGFWMMVAGTAAALAASVIAALPFRDKEPVTPPYGIPVPVEPSDGT